jgi:hypothetical protein
MPQYSDHIQSPDYPYSLIIHTSIASVRNDNWDCTALCIFIETVIPVKLVILFKMHLNDSCVKLYRNTLSDTFPIHNSLKQGDAALLLLFNFAVEHVH